jgi:hypothetical protein
MKNNTWKDDIGGWILLIWIGGTGLQRFSEFTDALGRGEPASTILWDAAVAGFVGICGVFLIRHYINLVWDVSYYRRQELERMEELERRRMDDLES